MRILCIPDVVIYLIIIYISLRIGSTRASPGGMAYKLYISMLNDNIRSFEGRRGIGAKFNSDMVMSWYDSCLTPEIITKYRYLYEL